MNNKIIPAMVATAALVVTGGAAVTSWQPEVSVSCEIAEFSHPQFRESTGPELTVQEVGSGGVILDTLIFADGYEWGDVYTFELDVDGGERLRFILRASNPALGGAYQQIGQVDAWVPDCTPEPETPEEETPEPETPEEETPEPETPVEETPEPETPVEETPEPETPVEDETRIEAPAPTVILAPTVPERINTDTSGARR